MGRQTVTRLDKLNCCMVEENHPATYSTYCLYCRRSMNFALKIIIYKNLNCWFKFRTGIFFRTLSQHNLYILKTFFGRSLWKQYCLNLKSYYQGVLLLAHKCAHCVMLDLVINITLKLLLYSVMYIININTV